MYGVEVPTQEKYRFVDEEGEKAMRARHDMVFFSLTVATSEPVVLLEYKRDQPQAGRDFLVIRKDLQKLFLEPVASGGGKCMFHILHAEDSGTLRPLRVSYDNALKSALQTDRRIARVSGDPLGDWPIVLVRMADPCGSTPA